MSKKPKTLLILGVISIALMVYTAATSDLYVMMFALMFSAGVGAYLLSTGIETRSKQKAATGGILLASTIIAIGLIISIAVLTSVTTILMPASEITITAIGSVIQTIIAYVCFVLGW